MNPNYLDIAGRIAARLCRDALWSRGRCNWTADFSEDGGIAHGALGPNLYAGTSGIALFLARRASVTGERMPLRMEPWGRTCMQAPAGSRCSWPEWHPLPANGFS